MCKYKKGDMLVVLQSSDRNNVGKVGEVIDITDGDYYTLDVMPNCAFKENCVGKAHGADLIRKERQRQIEVEGYDAMHDRHHTPWELCRAAVGYALHEDPSKLISNAAANLWPWNKEFWKPKDQLRNLVRAGALIAAAIDRLLRDRPDFICNRKECPSKPDRKFIQSVSIEELDAGILYIIVNTSERWSEYQLFRAFPGKGLVEVTFYENCEEYSETFPVSDDFCQFDYQFTSSQEKDQITIVCIPIAKLGSKK